MSEQKRVTLKTYLAALKAEEALKAKEAKIEKQRSPKIDLNRSRYYRELIHGSDIFVNDGSFLVKFSFDLSKELLKNYVKELKYLNGYGGIYILFNEEFAYVGQTSRGFAVRLEEHIRDINKGVALKKKPLFEGTISAIFFGRHSGIGSSVLDYMELKLITALKTGERKLANTDPGNKTYFSEDTRVQGELILQQAYNTCFLTSMNPFDGIELPLKEQGSDDFSVTNPLLTVETMEAISKAMRPFLDKLPNFIDDLVDPWMRYFHRNLVFIEYSWPISPRNYPIPLENERNKGYYSKERDGDFPKEFEAAKEFDEALIEPHLYRIGI